MEKVSFISDFLFTNYNYRSTLKKQNLAGCRPMIEDVFNVSKGIVLMSCLIIRSTFCQYAFDRQKLITVCTFWRICVFVLSFVLCSRGPAYSGHQR